MEDAFNFVVTAFAGLGIGLLSGLLGIGGGTIMIPLFRLVFAMSPLMTTATSLFAIVPTSLSGALTHIRNKTCSLPVGLAAGLGGACTSPLGVWLASISPGWAVMLAVALVIAYSATHMIVQAVRYDSRKAASVAMSASAQARTQVPASTPTRIHAQAGEVGQSAQARSKPEINKKQVLFGFLIGLAAGALAGYIGLGGGFLMVPMMLTFLHFPMRQASGTSLVAMVILVIPGVIGQGILGNVEYLAGIAVAVGSVPGAIVGARLVNRVPERVLRSFFGIFLVFVAVLLVLNEVMV